MMCNGIYGRLKPLAAMLMAMVVAILMQGCATDECLDNKNSLPLAGFYASGNPSQGVAVDSVTVAGLGAPGDSLVIDNGRNISETYLPFRIDEGESAFEIVYNFTAKDNGGVPLSDVISFEYDIDPYFVSSACGAIYEYKIKNISTTHTYIDSVSCPAGVIDNTPGQNIRIYFRVMSQEGGEE